MIQALMNRRFTTCPFLVALFLSAGAFGLSAQTITDVWGGARSCIALCSDSTVWCWGFNWFGKGGDGTANNVESIPVLVKFPWLTAAVEGRAKRTDGLRLTCSSNPFRKSISFQVSGVDIGEASELRIYNLSGNLIERLPAEGCGMKTTYVWNAGNRPGGFYVCRLETAQHAVTKELVVTKF